MQKEKVLKIALDLNQIPHNILQFLPTDILK